MTTLQPRVHDHVDGNVAEIGNVADVPYYKQHRFPIVNSVVVVHTADGGATPKRGRAVVDETKFERIAVWHPVTESVLVPNAKTVEQRPGTPKKYTDSDEWHGRVEGSQLGTVYVTNLPDVYGEWRSVPGFPAGAVLVSNVGWAMMKHSRGEYWNSPVRGWKCKGVPHVQVHYAEHHLARLVCRAFNGPPTPEKPFVMKLGNVKDAVEAHQLAWASKSDIRHMTHKAVDGNVRIEARKDEWRAEIPNKVFKTVVGAAHWFGVSYQSIKDHCDSSSCAKLEGWTLVRKNPPTKRKRGYEEEVEE
jgi:hypothetical protein